MGNCHSCGLVRVEANGDVLENRRARVEEWSASLRDSDDCVLETVQIFQALPEVRSREPFLAVFRKHDLAFKQRNNELEQRVLAGAALVRVVQRDEHADDGNWRGWLPADQAHGPC